MFRQNRAIERAMECVESKESVGRYSPGVLVGCWLEVFVFLR